MAMIVVMEGAAEGIDFCSDNLKKFGLNLADGISDGCEMRHNHSVREAFFAMKRGAELMIR